MLITALLFTQACSGGEPLQPKIITPPPGVTYAPQARFTPPVVKSGASVTVYGIGFTPRTRLNAYAGFEPPYDQIVIRNIGETDREGAINATVSLNAEFTVGRYIIFLADEFRSSRSGGAEIVIE